MALPLAPPALPAPGAGHPAGGLLGSAPARVARQLARLECRVPDVDSLPQLERSGTGTAVAGYLRALGLGGRLVSSWEQVGA